MNSVSPLIQPGLVQDQPDFGHWHSTRRAVGISLILPMYNETENVDHTLPLALEKLDQYFEDFEIIVVDDASTDGCADQVADWAQRDERIRLIRLPRNQRFGGALRAGLADAQMEYLFYTDFDLPIGLDCLPGMIEKLEFGDVLTGYAEQECKHANWQAAVISWGYNFLVRLLFGFQLRDINFGFKAMRRSVYEKMQLRSCSPFVDAEMFAQARSHGCTVHEVPVAFSMRQAGVSHIRRWDVIAQTFCDMLRVRWAMFVSR
jgi:glycosyltransferase involved in cell wall biosynthesis